MSTPADSASADAGGTAALESENAALAARSFRIAGPIVFLFQFLYFAADRATKTQHQHFFLPYFTVNGIDAMFAIAVTYTRWFPRYWKPLALVQVGLLDGTGTIMNIVRGTVTPQFYIINMLSIGCATFLPWGVKWQSALNLICLASMWPSLKKQLWRSPMCAINGSHCWGC